MRPPGYLTIDVGSSGVRATLFSPDLVRLASAERSGTQQTTSIQAEVNVDELRETVIAVAREVVTPDRPIAAVGITAQLGLVMADAAGDPLRPAILWPDHRAGREADQLAEAYGDESIYRVAGRRVNAELPAPKLLWLKHNEPAVWRRIRSVLSLKDYLVYCLTGSIATDPVHASYSLLFDVAAGKWHETLVRDLGLEAVTVPVLPGFALAGRVTSTAAGFTGIRAGTPVIVGGPDGSVGALGAGLNDPGTAVDIAGTTDVFFASVDRPVFDPERRVVLNASLLPGRWSVGGPSGMTGGMLRWFAEEFATVELADAEQRNISIYSVLDEAAATIPAGAGGLVVLPAMTGERAPTWDRFRRGAFIGLSVGHRRAHVARAILEGSAFALGDLVDAVLGLGVRIDEIRLAGGGARSQLWGQIKADVCERPFLVVREISASSLGTAMLAAVATGAFESVSAAAEKAVKVDRVAVPTARDAAIYRHLRPLARGIADRLAPDFAALAAELGRENRLGARPDGETRPNG
jgi:xylulokinase